jgi:hypothetical protein
MWPGDTADVTTLLPVIDRLRQRFSIGRVRIGADRGMISPPRLPGSKPAPRIYLGARQRGDAIVKNLSLKTLIRSCRF